MYLDSATVGRVEKEGADIDRQWRAAKRAILAYCLGRWREGESPLEALARVLDVPPQDILTELASHSTERDELDLLSSCLGVGRLDLSDLSIQDGVALMVMLINRKLAQVPAEVRHYFGAPGKLNPFPNIYPSPRSSQTAHGSTQ